MPVVTKQRQFHRTFRSCSVATKLAALKLAALSATAFAAWFFHVTAAPAWAESVESHVNLASEDTSALEKQLEQQLQGKQIRTITITVRDIFDAPDPPWVYRAANRLKVQTRESVIRRELYFKEGDRYDQFLVDESIRNLRSLNYLRHIEVIPEIQGDEVDLHVTVQDTWTLIPQLSYSSGDGRERRSVGIAESDLLGYGKRAEVLYEDDHGRDTLEFVWDDRRVMNSDLSLVVGAFDRTDGERYVTSLGRPFRSLVEKTSWKIRNEYIDSVGRLYGLGTERFIFRQEKIDLAGRYTIAKGNPQKRLRRYSIGYNYQDAQFDEAKQKDFDDLDLDPDSVETNTQQLAENRRYSGPVLTYEKVEPDFISMNYIDRFDRVADYNLGETFAGSVFFAPDILGSVGDTLHTSVNQSFGIRFDESAFLRGEVGAATRFGSGKFSNSLGRAELKYYNVLGPLWARDVFLGKHTLAARFSVNYGDDLDGDRDFLLGADNGLRGYEARTFFGDKRMRLNIEDRFHLVEDIWQFFSVGGVVFLDAGGVTNKPFADLLGDEIYSDVGFGLRFAFPRSSGGRILRVDIAFPLRDGPDGSNRGEPRILFSGGQVFGSTLQSEALGVDGVNVSSGFAD